MDKKLNDRNTLVCNRTTIQSLTRSLVKQCEDCGHDVWVAPSGLYQAGADAKLVCNVCICSYQDNEMQLNMPSEAQLKVIMANTGRTREDILEFCQSLCDEVKRTGQIPKVVKDK